MEKSNSLHLITRSPFQSHLDEALNCISPNDQVVLMGEGCYLLQKKALLEQLPHPVLVLEADCAERGLTIDHEQIRAISMTDCVSYSLNAKHVLTW